MEENSEAWEIFMALMPQCSNGMGVSFRLDALPFFFRMHQLPEEAWPWVYHKLLKLTEAAIPLLVSKEE